MSDFHAGDVGLVLDEVSDERRRQHEKWGEQNHTPGFWLMILGEEVGEANKAALEAAVAFRNEMHRAHGNPWEKPATDRLHDECIDWDRVNLADFRKELIQVAAVAVAMVERIDRGNW